MVCVEDALLVYCSFYYDVKYPQFELEMMHIIPSVESQKGAISLFKDVPLRTRRALSLYKVYGDGAPLVLNETSLNSDSSLLALS